MTTPKKGFSKPKDFQVDRTHNLGDMEDLSKSIGPLYRPMEVATIRGHKIRYIRPGFYQCGLVFQFLVEAIKEEVIQPGEIGTLRFYDILPRCMERFALIQDVGEMVEKAKGITGSNKAAEEQRLLRELSEKYGGEDAEDLVRKANTASVRLFINPIASRYIHQAIEQCFPDLINPSLLTKDAFADAAIAIMTHAVEEFTGV